MTLEELKNAIIADGIVDAEEVAQLRTILLADGVIDREEADLLFALNDATTGNNNSPEWKAFFVEALTAHVLADDNTPGELDAEESTYIIDQINGDGQVDALEVALVTNIAKVATKVTPEFTAFVESLTPAEATA